MKPLLPPWVEVVSDAEAEKADFAVCVRKGTPTPFSDNIEAVCALCGAAIVHRPYMPKRLMRICLECAVALPARPLS